MGRKKKTVSTTTSTTDLAEPQTRTEGFLAKIAGLSDTLPQGEFSRLERYLHYIAENGGGGGGGSLPFVEDTENPGCYYRDLGGGAKEWLNPPMALGVEYRTSDRWNGKAVYTMLIECNRPSSPNSEATTNTNITGLTNLLSCEMSVRIDISGYTQYLAAPFSSVDYGTINAYGTYSPSYLTTIVSYTKSGASIKSAKATVRYVKT